MELHTCNQQQTIGEIHGLLKTMVKQVYGNGQEGLATSVPKLQSSIQILTEQVAAHTQVISDLIKFQANFNGSETQKGKDDINARHKTVIAVSGIIGLSSVIIAFLNYLK
jgi:hypothetical protein